MNDHLQYTTTGWYSFIQCSDIILFRKNRKRTYFHNYFKMLNRNVNYTPDEETNCKSSSSQNDKQMTSAVSTSSKSAVKYGDPKCLFLRDIDSQHPI